MGPMYTETPYTLKFLVMFMNINTYREFNLN